MRSSLFILAFFTLLGSFAQVHQMQSWGGQGTIHDDWHPLKEGQKDHSIQDGALALVGMDTLTVLHFEMQIKCARDPLQRERSHSTDRFFCSLVSQLSVLEAVPGTQQHQLRWVPPVPAFDRSCSLPAIAMD